MKNNALACLALLCIPFLSQGQNPVSQGQNPVPLDSIQTRDSRFLLFPFFLRSPETDWGFGGAAAYFFKPDKKDSLLRTSDVSLLGLYTLNEQVVIVLNSTVYFPG